MGQQMGRQAELVAQSKRSQVLSSCLCTVKRNQTALRSLMLDLEQNDGSKQALMQKALEVLSECKQSLAAFKDHSSVGVVLDLPSELDKVDGCSVDLQTAHEIEPSLSRSVSALAKIESKQLQQTTPTHNHAVIYKSCNGITATPNLRVNTGTSPRSKPDHEQLLPLQPEVSAEEKGGNGERPGTPLVENIQQEGNSVDPSPWEHPGSNDSVHKSATIPNLPLHEGKTSKRSYCMCGCS